MSYANLNLLPLALTLVPPTPVEYRTASATTVNEYGQAVTTYSPWKTGYGIVVPNGVQNASVEGIDQSPRGVRAFIRGVDLKGTNDQATADQIRADGRVYNIVSVDDWLSYDNFRSYACQEVKNQ